MSVELEDHPEVLAELGPELEEVLRSSWAEATRVMSPRALDTYLRGALDLKLLERGSDLVASYLQSAPAVVREVGEDALGQLLSTAITMYSKTSASVIALVLSTSPVAAARLGDPELFEDYLRLLHTLVAQAPRGLRPMLEKLDVLLSNLTLGGLRRWATWGVQAHGNDFDAQEAYFGLESADARAMFQRERRGTLFVDVQRRLRAYLRALWGQDFFLRPTSGDPERDERPRPYIAGFVVHLPDAYDEHVVGERTVGGMDLYRAAGCHAAAHLLFGDRGLRPEGLSALQREVIGVVEDARVEQLAIDRFPGLGVLWRRLHDATPQDAMSVGDFLGRIARALVDPDYEDDARVVEVARKLFAEACAELGSSTLSWEIGLELTQGLAELGVEFRPGLDHVRAPYRDDNRHLWEEFDPAAFFELAPWVQKQVRRTVSLMEFVNELDVETAGDDAQEVWVLPTELFPYEDEGVSFNQLEGRAQPAEVFRYPEWDYQMQLYRPAWCSVLETRPAAGDPSEVERILEKHRPLVARLRRIVEAMQPVGVQRLRKQEEGDDFDLNALVFAMTELRLRREPDPRVMQRTLRRERDLAVLVLVDVSESTNGPVEGSDLRVIDLAREATVLLADALDRLGDPFAIHGFHSNGRHDVEYFRYKDFDVAYGERVKASLAGMTGQLSTRMGAAIRHATSLLRRQPNERKLLFVVTDGEPADNDVRDPQYLRVDAKKAVEEATTAGIQPYCISLDPRSDEWVSRIFGVRNAAIVDRVERLPERLPLLYMGLTR
ncbi:nitric oxide reductase activation protein NorD [Aciditerrimonas ferrireducens]|uniref:Nitric oxide reductase activation protein NorD n=1 Tax=Aciditerrimonas ferrireducens TaxID=667306 RepID=A0ABV6C1G6_9ACTN